MKTIAKWSSILKTSKDPLSNDEPHDQLHDSVIEIRPIHNSLRNKKRKKRSADAEEPSAKRADQSSAKMPVDVLISSDEETEFVVPILEETEAISSSPHTNNITNGVDNEMGHENRAEYPLWHKQVEMFIRNDILNSIVSDLYEDFTRSPMHEIMKTFNIKTFVCEEESLTIVIDGFLAYLNSKEEYKNIFSSTWINPSFTSMLCEYIKHRVSELLYKSNPSIDKENMFILMLVDIFLVQYK